MTDITLSSKILTKGSRGYPKAPKNPYTPKTLKMNYKLHTKSDATTPTVIIHPEASKADKGILGKNKAELLSLHLKKKTFTGEKDQSIATHLSNNGRLQKVLFFGCGKEKEISEKSVRNQAAKVIKAAQSWEEKIISIVIPEAFQEHLQAFAEGIGMGSFNPAIYKTGKEQEKRQKKRIKTIHLIAPNWNKTLEKELEKGSNIAEVVNYTRNIVNCGPKQLSISQFAKEVRQVAKDDKYKLTDMTKRQLEKLKMGGILAVNRGSTEPAHMMILEHKGVNKEAPIVICGKGIIFDTGGISLKPSTHMHEMQLDMGGAAVVLGIFKLLKKLDIKRHVIGIMPITDNAIGSDAYRPSEIVTTYSGQTVEIMNTDAEGRMILSDALYYGATKYKPKYLIDLATLTGACMVALGYRTAGLFGNNDKLIKKFQEAADRTDEALCHIPITEIDEKSMKGKIADLTNLDSSSRYAGAPRAAAFLKNFVEKTKWAHIDIAGTAFTKEPKDYEVNMATGFGIRLMIDFLEKL